MITSVIEENIVETSEGTLPAPEWEQFLFVLDEKLNYTPYLVCKGKKKFYKVNIWTLTEKVDKWYASPRITTQITSASANRKLSILASGKPCERERAYTVMFGDGVMDLDDPNIPIGTLLSDCVVSDGEEAFTRPTEEQIKKIYSRFETAEAEQEKE